MFFFLYVSWVGSFGVWEATLVVNENFRTMVHSHQRCFFLGSNE